MLRAEIKKIVFSFTYILFVVVMIATYITQMVPSLDGPFEKPDVNQEYYGSKEFEDPNILMPAATENLICEYMTGYYVAYPTMFYKAVHLKEAEQEEMLAIIYRLSGLTKEEMDNFTDFAWGGYVYVEDETGHLMPKYTDASLPEYHFNTDVTYEEFKGLMEKADELIGGGSSYAAENLVVYFSNVPMNYEEAVEEFDQIVNEENIAKSYTRLYCDYMGIFIALITVFTVAEYWYLDKRAKVTSLVYSRKVSNVRIIFTRVVALVITCFPVVLGTYLHMMIKVNSFYGNMDIQWLDAIKIMFMWLLPEMLFEILLATFVTEVISPLVAIFLQVIWWYLAINAGNLVDGINRWNLIVRHNTMGEVNAWANSYGDFVFNRMLYLGLSGVIIICLIAVYSSKRKGKFGIEFKNILRNRSKKSAEIF